MDLLTPRRAVPATPYNPLDLSGRTVLVTGASSGIGRATALYLSRLGAKVIATGRDRDRVQETVDALTGDGHLGTCCDLGEVAAIPGWLKSLCAEVGGLHGIAHCAGIQATKPIRLADAAFIEQALMTNLGSALMLAQAFRQKGCHAPAASLVLVSSSAALRTAPGNTVYAASKGGIVAATKGLGVELLRDGIRVNCVAPAMVETEMSARFRQALSEENYQRVVDMHPLGVGQPDDVAGAIAFLLADTGRWITGSTLCVDGGFLA